MTPSELAAIESRANVDGLPSRADLHALVAEVRRLQAERDEWKRLAEWREDAHTQGYREGRALADAEIDDLKQRLQGGRKCRAPAPCESKDSLEAQKVEALALDMMRCQVTSLLPPGIWAAAETSWEREWNRLSDAQRDAWRERARRHREQYPEADPDDALKP